MDCKEEEGSTLVKLISCDEASIYLNRYLLENTSEYFRGLFSSGMVDCIRTEFKLEPLYEENLAEVMKYYDWFCKGRECFPMKHVRNLERIECGLMSAFYLLIDGMISLYFKKLKSILDITNWHLVSKIAEQFSSKCIRNALSKFIIQNFEEVLNSNNLHLLLPYYMEHALKSDEIFVMSEFKLFEGVLKWLAQHEQHNWMLNLIRYELMDAMCLKMCERKLRRSDKPFNQILITSMSIRNPSLQCLLQNEDTMQDIVRKLNPGKLKRNLEALQHPLLNSIHYHHPHHPPSPVRLRDSSLVFITLGGFTGLDTSSNQMRMMMMDEMMMVSDVSSLKDRATIPHCTSWHLPTKLCEHQVVLLNGVMYVAGGQAKYNVDGSGTLPTVHKFNPLTATWMPCTKMTTPRSLFYLAVVSNRMYAIGGSICANTDTPKVEWYDPFLDTWTEGDPLPFSVHEHAGCVKEEVIYISGGYKGSTMRHTGAVLQYDLHTKLWTSLPSLLIGRSYHSMVAWKSTLLVVGGVGNYSNSDAFDVLNGELFDAEAQQWSRVVTLPHPASCMSHLLIHHHKNNHNHEDNNNKNIFEKTNNHDDDLQNNINHENKNNNITNNNDKNNNHHHNINNKENSKDERLNTKNDWYIDNNGNEYCSNDDMKTDKLVLFGGHMFETMSCHNICQVIDLPRGGGDGSRVSNGGYEDEELGIVKRKYLKEDKNVDFVVNTFEFKDLNVFTFPSCVLSLSNSVVQEALL